MLLRREGWTSHGLVSDSAKSDPFRRTRDNEWQVSGSDDEMFAASGSTRSRMRPRMVWPSRSGGELAPDFPGAAFEGPSLVDGFPSASPGSKTSQILQLSIPCSNVEALDEVLELRPASGFFGLCRRKA